MLGVVKFRALEMQFRTFAQRRKIPVGKFVYVTGLEQVWAAGFKEAVELVFLISDVEGNDRQQRLELELSKKTFRLGCTPAVNLFPQVAEPIQLTQRKYEYAIVPDVRRPYATEVFSVDEVGCINTSIPQTTTFEPFSSLRHSGRTQNMNAIGLLEGGHPIARMTKAPTCPSPLSICPCGPSIRTRTFSPSGRRARTAICPPASVLVMKTATLNWRAAF
jgi:hypothetical protein